MGHCFMVRIGRLHFLSCLLSLFAFAATLVNGDGGTLQFVENDGTVQIHARPLRNTSYQSQRSANVRLEDESNVQAHLWEIPTGDRTLKLLSTTKPPYRFACDRNGDGEYGTEDISVSHSASMGHYTSVGVPVTLGDGVRLCRMDVYVTGRGRNRSLIVMRVRSSHAGDIVVGGERYAARLVFRNGVPSDRYGGGMLILDANRDGRFDHFTDPWFSSHGVAYLRDALWNVNTTFSENHAHISIEPYSGPTGAIHVDGEGLRRLYLSLDSDAGSYDICLPQREDQMYTVPLGAGAARVSDAWIQAGTSTNPLFQLALDSSLRPVSIRENGTSILEIGGRLQAKLRVRSNPFLGRVTLDYKGCIARGLKYNAVDPGHPDGGLNPPAPWWEVRDAEGNVVATGQFEYG